ncbi:MAG TPA: hypothetical protein VLI06_03955 [Solimonas sp.]|nr:hypothetical protein [Solimonas sp.]
MQNQQTGSTIGPRRVFLFSGHMIDAPDRSSPRFPADQEPVAANAIAGLLDRLAAGSADLAISGGACGGDLLFAEAVLARGLALEIYLPFEETAFLASSVDFAGADWRRRFEVAKRCAELHVLPQERPPLHEGQDAYEMTNLWMLEAAMRFGPEKVDFISLWNGQKGDGPGGTQHLMQEVRANAGRVHWIDTTQLWNGGN